MRSGGVSTSRHTHGQLGWLALLVLTAAATCGAKLYLALHTEGAYDVYHWRHFLDALRSSGDVLVYQFEPLYIHPPFILHLLRALGALSDGTGLPWNFVIRLPAIAADLASAVVLWLLYRRGALGVHAGLLVVTVLAPASLIVSGWHGNTDPLMVFFVLLAVAAMEGSPRAWPAGLALGMALNIKLAAVIFLPPVLLYRGGVAARLRFLAALAGVWVVASLPVLWRAPRIVIAKLLSYGSASGRWGLTQGLDAAESCLRALVLGTSDLSGSVLVLRGYAAALAGSQGYPSWGRALALAAVILAALAMNRHTPKPRLFLQCGVCAFLFLFLSPGFQPHYLAWLVPFAMAGGWIGALLYHTASGAFMYEHYSVRFAWDTPGTELGVGCWLAVGILAALLYWRAIRSPRALAAAQPARHGWVIGLAAASMVIVVLLTWRPGRAASLRDAWRKPLVVASSTFTLGPVYHAADAVDGYAGVDGWAAGLGWNSLGTPTADAPEYLLFVFPWPRVLDHLALYSYPDARYSLRSFVFQYKSGRDWVDVPGTCVAGDTGATSWAFDFPPISVGLLRLMMFDAPERYARVLEVEFDRPLAE